MADIVVESYAGSIVSDDLNCNDDIREAFDYMITKATNKKEKAGSA